MESTLAMRRKVPSQMRRRRLVLCFACAALPSCSGVVCPADWHRIGDHCYWVSLTQHTFEQCQVDVCSAKNASLACIRYEEVDEIVDNVIGIREELLAAWIGYSKALPGKQWTWLNGCQNTWTYWLPGEPNNYCGGEDCAAITTASGQWAEVSCRLTMPCLCEYPMEPALVANLSETNLRDDTCYADCGDLTRWCSAWPFLRADAVQGDLCSWEEGGGQRGRGAGECAERAAKNAECGPFISYSVGRCRCSPASGLHANCSHREPDVASDVFAQSEDGPQLAYSGQRCVYALDIDTDHFASLKPASTWTAALGRWFRAASIWLVFGLPCGLMMLVVMAKMCRNRARQPMEESKPEGPLGPEAVDAAYGPLIETDGDEGSAEVVNRWIFRSASSTIAYGAALLALGFTLAAHMAGRNAGFQMELLESLIMAITMSLVTRAACMVHRRLAPIARQVAGPWVLVVALASFGMALTAIAGVMVFSTLADADYENICFAQYLFRWSMLVVLPLQSLAGFAVWQLQSRAQRYAGTEEAKAGGWTQLLVLGYFGAGFWMWWAGYLDCVHEAGGAVAVCFVAAAGSQLTAGLSLMMVNRKVKQYFRRNAGVTVGVPATQVGFPTLEDDPAAI